ncbi:GNAT family N-acetyltransferase [Alkalilimnicola ehrlichii]|uniref:GNAT family N-acetyltransferase n=1 Tax=Alkalilimnicola ehrlichii TaxID=351052 RepID=A0A3E0WWD7_9GAMM|nr:GNAT family N-acetyltransferase [Alkalilimnicola ehrlichii]RFA29903.1 GNAT family N-acetyltransferase [Alkalilimnicola ehrlichii]RFA36493.1 GNAT family N-acetyltransferase [Alkalilimnicola ehrlichii]
MPHESARLYLRQWQASDLAPFAELNADPRVMAHFPNRLDRAQSDAMAERCRALIEERGWGFWAVEEKASNTFIGFVGLHTPAADLPFSPCVEVGWRLAYPFWGKGLATEAAKVALQIGFNELRLDEIVSFTAVSNQRSRRVMRRLGMQAAGVFEHPAIPAGHALRRHYLFRLSAAAWRAGANEEIRS